MCEKAVKKFPCLLKYVPDQFVTDQQIKIWHDNDYHCNDDKLIEWHKGYQKRKTQKAKIKEGSYPVPGIHQDIGIGVRQKMKKKDRKIMGIDMGLQISRV